MYWKILISLCLVFVSGFTEDVKKPDIIPECPFWTISEIQFFSVPHDLCLAANKKTMECFLTVGEFNRKCETLKTSSFLKTEMSLDSARKQVFDLLLKKKCAFSYIKEKNIDTVFFQDKSVDQEKKFYAKDKQEIFDKELYEKYYHYFFRQTDLLRISLVGSTDSCALAAWWNGFQGTSKNSNKEHHDIDTAIPWIGTWDTLVDNAVLEKLIKLKTGMVTKPFSTSFGFFVARLDSIKPVDEIPFEKAAPILHDIRLKYEIDKEIAYEYYKARKDSFCSPDTLIIQSWLVSDSIRSVDSAAYRLCISQDSVRSYHDTSHTLPLTVTQFDLPCSIQHLFAGDSLSLSVLYTLSHTPYGKWYFKVLKKIPGGKPVAFNMIDWPQQDLRHLEAVFALSVKNRYQQFEDHIKANLIKKQLLSKQKEPSAEQIAECIEKGIIDTGIINRSMRKHGTILQVKKERNEYMHQTGELPHDQYLVLQKELDKKIAEFEKNIADMKKNIYINVYKNYVVEKDILNWQAQNVELQNRYLFFVN